MRDYAYYRFWILVIIRIVNPAQEGDSIFIRDLVHKFSYFFRGKRAFRFSVPYVTHVFIPKCWNFKRSNLVVQKFALLCAIYRNNRAVLFIKLGPLGQ